MFFSGCANNDELDSLLLKSDPKLQQDFSLMQMEAFYGEVQMSYLLRTGDNKLIVIDGGGEATSPILEEELKKLGGKVDTWIITHPHSDHVNALLGIIERGNITIDRLLHVPLNEAWVQRHEPTAYDLVAKYNAMLIASKIPTTAVQAGDVFTLGEGVSMQVLGGFNEAFTTNAVNNSSMVFKINSKSKSVLFTGDLGIEGGREVLKRNLAEDLRADYVQMAHHGQNGVSRDFYEAVQAKYALWPTPNWLWDNQLAGKEPNSGTFKTLIVRSWMEELKIQKNYVSGLDGTVLIY